MLLSKSITNASLRASILVIKFGFSLFALNQLSLEDFGLYGLIFSVVGYSMLPLGAEYHALNSRYLAQSNPSEYSEIISRQMKVLGWSYITTFPFVLFFCLAAIGLGPALLSLIILLIVCEHLSQEAIRAQVAMGSPIFATCCMFMKQALWMLFLMLSVLVFETPLSITIILLWWLAGNAACLAMVFLSSSRLLSNALKTKSTVDDWFGLVKKLIPFLVSALALRGLLTFDKIQIEATYGLTYLAVYVFYLSIVNALVSLLESGVLAFSLPKLVRHANSNEQKAYLAEVTLLTRRVLWFLALAVPGFVALIIWLPPVLGKTEFSNFPSLVYLAVIICVLQISSGVMQFLLYTLKMDCENVLINIIGFITFIFLSYFLSKGFESGIVVALILSLGFINLVKFSWFLKCVKSIDFRGTSQNR